MAAPATRTRLTPWLRLVRFPNLLTVPGDPVAGAVLWQLATGTGLEPPRMAAAAAISTWLYAAGLIDNDVADHAEDRAAGRPRPLVTGAIPVGRARLAEALLIGLALVLAQVLSASTSVTCLALLVCILVYNRQAKDHPVAGPLMMGLCRGLSLAMGAVAAAGPPALQTPVVLAGAVGTTAYIAAVTSIARTELTAGVRPGRRWLPGLAAAALAAALACLAPSLPPLWYAAAAIAVAGPMLTGGRLAADSSPADIQRAIGGWIRGLLLLQAMGCALHAGTGQLIAYALLLLVPLNARLAKKFYAT